MDPDPEEGLGLGLGQGLERVAKSPTMKGDPLVAHYFTTATDRDNKTNLSDLFDDAFNVSMENQFNTNLKIDVGDIKLSKSEKNSPYEKKMARHQGLGSKSSDFNEAKVERIVTGIRAGTRCDKNLIRARTNLKLSSNYLLYLIYSCHALSPCSNLVAVDVLRAPFY